MSRGNIAIKKSNEGFHRSGAKDQPNEWTDDQSLLSGCTLHDLPPSEPRTYSIHCTLLSGYHIQTARGKQSDQFFADTSPLALLTNGEDITLYLGDDTTGLILGAARFRRPSRSIRYSMGLEERRRKHWPVLQCVNSVYGTYRWEWEADQFIWAELDSENIAHQSAGHDMKLTNMRSGEVLALYRSNESSILRNGGTIDIRESLGSEWELVVVLTAVSLVERCRRRKLWRIMSVSRGSMGVALS